MAKALSVLILIYSCTICTSYLVLASLLHSEFDDRNLNSYYYGLILSCYGLFGIFSVICVPKLIKILGRSKVLYLGIILISICICCFGFVTLIENDAIMVITAIILRSLQGFTRTLSTIPCLSLIVMLEPEQRIKYLGYLDAALTIGDGLGPVVGSVLYKIFGFIYMFIILGCFHFIYIPLMILAMPKNIDSDSEDTKSLVKSNSINSTDSGISIYKLLSNRLIILCSIAELNVFISNSYFEPMLSFRVAEFTESIFIQGLMYTIFVIGLAMMSLIIPYFSKLINPIYMISLGLLLCGLSNFLVGPSNLLPNNLILMGLGLFLSGFTMVLSTIPQIPLMMNQAEKMFPSETRKASDISSSIYILNHRTGLLLGPVYGGYMNYLVGYRTTCDILAIFLITYSVIFYLLTRGYTETTDEEKSRSNIAVSDYNSKNGLIKKQQA